MTALPDIADDSAAVEALAALALFRAEQVTGGPPKAESDPPPMPMEQRSETGGESRDPQDR